MTGTIDPESSVYGNEIEVGRARDRNRRLIEGQVFLRESGQDWRDLWDEDGTIAR